MSLGFRTVLFSPLVPDGSGAERVATGIAYRWRAVKPWDAGASAGAMETQWTTWLVINGTADTADLPITPAGNGLDVEIQTRIGTSNGRPSTRMETVAIPTGTGTIDYYNTVSGEGTVLVRLDRSTLLAIPAPPSDTVQAQLDALDARIDAVSGGATNLGGITDMSPFMRTVNDDTTAAAARTTLGAGTSSLAVGTLVTDAKAGNYQPAATNISDSTAIGRTVLTAADAAAVRVAIGAGASGLTIGTTTGTAADGGVVAAGFTASSAALAAAMDTVPYPFYATGTAYAGRPVTPRPVWWMSWDVAPPATSGTVTSGTGPVVGLDVVFLGVGVVPG